MVFPEMTLNTVLTTTFVPDPKLKIVPCDNADYEEFLSSMSCTARDSRKYLVINVIEKATCTNATQESIGDPRPCSSNGLNSYNTNVVFDRNGAVISRYRKWNLFGELGRNTTYKPEYGVFDTDFGVRFGHFICFDILFYTPAQEIVSSGVTDFVFPTMWFSELPFLTGWKLFEGTLSSRNLIKTLLFQPSKFNPHGRIPTMSTYWRLERTTRLWEALALESTLENKDLLLQL